MPLFFIRSAQAAYKAEYRMSTVVGNAFPWGKGGDIWINLVKERTQGRIVIKMYPGVSLINGDQTREFSAVRQGVIDLAVGSTGALILVVVVLLLIGMVLDGVSIFLIFVPLLMPLMKTYAWDPVWFGLILTYMVAIGQFTPPIAVNLMVSARLAGARIEDTVRWVVWFVLAMMILLALLIAVPSISLWLPDRPGY